MKNSARLGPVSLVAGNHGLLGESYRISMKVLAEPVAYQTALI